MMKSPVRPPLALTVGVIGHRPNRIPEGARTRIDADIAAVLAAIKAAAEAARARHAEVFAAEPARPVLLSALAEGADRYAALAAIDAGVTLSVALPFPVEDYAKDFAEPASRDEYARLIAAADKVLVLPGRHEAAAHAYDGVGVVILENSDVILAVWDGGASAGKGGTTDLVGRAAAKWGCPLSTSMPSAKPRPACSGRGWPTIPSAGSTSSTCRMRPPSRPSPRVVDRVVRPPADPDERRRLSRYLASAAIASTGGLKCR